MIHRIFGLIFIASMTIFAQAPSIEPGVSLELARWRAAHYSDVRYKLNLTLEKMSPVLKGTIEIRVTVGTRTPSSAVPVTEGAVTPIIIDWRKIKGHEEKSKVSNVYINGKAAVSAPPGEPAVADEGVRVPNEAVADEGVRVPNEAVADEGVRVPYEEQDEHLIFRHGVIAGENVIKLDFTSPILTSGSAITRYVDKEDGSEYIYSLFVPSDASTAFPVFDQPDLKARFSLTTIVPSSWKVISNSGNRNSNDAGYKGWIDQDVVGHTGGKGEWITTNFFDETKPISTYVFAFAAGPWERVSEPPALAGGENVADRDVGTRAKRSGGNQPPGTSGVRPPADAGGSDKNGGLGTSIYVRRSQAAKFKPHSAEVFRLIREDIKYLEGYFDYKFPWPKYDLVLIPEFPFGGMEHAGATFVRESGIIFPTEPTKSDHISRATLIFHENAHQWFGDCVTMKWFDDLWLKEGFANFMAYKALEKIMPEMNAWKVFYERIKQPAYATDSTKGTTPIYQPIRNLSAAKSAYGNIVYNKAPAFLRQAEFFLGEDKFQTAVQAFLKKNEYSNATWQGLVAEFENARGRSDGPDVKNWATTWVNRPGVPVLRVSRNVDECIETTNVKQTDVLGNDEFWPMALRSMTILGWRNNDHPVESRVVLDGSVGRLDARNICNALELPKFTFPNLGDYGYGVFLLDRKSREYVLKNVQNEKDPFLRTMMWGALWDSVREGELDPRAFVELVVRVLSKTENRPGVPRDDESTVAFLLNRVGTAMNYYLSESSATAGGQKRGTGSMALPAVNAAGSDLRTRVENMLIDRMQNAATPGERITYYRAFLNIAASANARSVLKEMLRKAERAASTGGQKAGTGSGSLPAANAAGADKTITIRTKDKFDIVTRLAILGDPDAEKLLAELEKRETSDDAKRYAYAAHAAFATKENRENYWSDFVNNKDISESWIESAMGPFNSIRHDDLSLPYLERALKELPNLKRSRKIFFVNGWLGAFIGGQRSQAALDIVNKFLADDPQLDSDLRLKILENIDVVERAVRIRARYPTSER